MRNNLYLALKSPPRAGLGLSRVFLQCARALGLLGELSGNPTPPQGAESMVRGRNCAFNPSPGISFPPFPCCLNPNPGKAARQQCCPETPAPGTLINHRGEKLHNSHFKTKQEAFSQLWQHKTHPKQGASATSTTEVSAFTLSHMKKAKSNLK